MPTDLPDRPNAVAVEREVEALQVASVFRSLPLASAAAFFGTLLCLTVFAGEGLKGMHVAWFAFATIVAALRLGLCWAWGERERRGWDLAPRDWARLLVLGNALAGIQWGLVGTLLFPVEPGFRQSFAIMVITCYVGGSITAYAPVRWAHPALALPATLPATAYIFFIESGTHWLAGFTAYFFIGMVLFYALRESELVAERLRADVRLRRQLRTLEKEGEERALASSAG